MPDTAEVELVIQKATPQAVATSSTRQAITRLDPITGQSTIFAPQRDERPDQFGSVPKNSPNTAIGCPFCTGAESQTPTPVWLGRKIKTRAADGCTEDFSSNQLDPNKVDSNHADSTSDVLMTGSLPPTVSRRRSAGDMAQHAAFARQTSLAHIECIDDPYQLATVDDSDWLVRVVPNKFPAITRIEETDDSANTAKISRRSKLFMQSPVRGGHEVIIESPDHCESIAALGTSHLAVVLAAIRDRIRYWRNVDSIAYVGVFKNCGGEAGASLAHSHSQVIAADMLPGHIRETVNRSARYQAETGCCLQCDLIRAEIKDKARIIAKSGSLVAFCPFASPMPMAVRITPQIHADCFEHSSDETIELVARLLKRVTAWLEQLLPGKSYNFVLNTRPPAATHAANSYHWSLDIFPRLSRIAGFEFGSQCMINSVMPEDAAAQFRQCAASEDPRAVH